MFWVAGELFGFTFTPVTGVPVYHPDVRVWEVKDAERQARRPLVLRSLRARRQALGRLDERLPHPGAVRRRRSRPSSRTTRNFVKGKPGEPVLISLGRRRDAVPRVRPRAARPELERELSVALRHRGGARLRRVPVAAQRALAADARGARTASRCTTRPASRSRQALVAKIEKAAHLQPGLRRPSSTWPRALVDMKLHLAGDADDRPGRVRARRRWPSSACPREIVMRHRTPQFGHVFAGDGYSAGYYSYLWSDTLTADACEAFEEAPAGSTTRPSPSGCTTTS